MPFPSLRLDLRAPAWGTPIDRLYAEGLAMAQWADRNGFAECVLSEHHGAEDGYLPAPLVYGAAIAARTQRLRIQVSALILPLHDPLRVAEDIAVLDRAWTGEPFEYRGRTIRVTPRPLQRPRPPIFLGGSTVAAARRAAHAADGFIPIVPDLYPAYVEECRRLGHAPGRYRSPGPFAVHVSNDPERA